jgi:hypothetical protein
MLAPFFLIDDYYYWRDSGGMLEEKTFRAESEFLVLEINKQPDFDIITSLN